MPLIHFDVNHAENGLDMVALANTLGGNAIFSGYSAGGLSAGVAAASLDAVGLLGLDATDGGYNDNSVYASGLTIPVMGVLESQVDAGKQWCCWTKVSKYHDACVCDFEAPTDMVCEALSNQRWFSNEEINSSILSLSTAALFWISTQDPEVSQMVDLWWRSRQFNEWSNEGL